MIRMPARIRKRLLLAVAAGLAALMFLGEWQTQRDRLWRALATRGTVFCGCLEDVVAVQRGGRFGNAFMEYASALGVARRYNLTLVLPSEIALRMGEAFEGVEAPSLQEYLKGRTAVDGLPCSSCLTEEDVFAQPLRWMVCEREPILQGAGPIVIRLYIVHEKYIVPIAPALRRTLRFRPELREHAQNVLRPLGEEVAKAAGTRLEDSSTVRAFAAGAGDDADTLKDLALLSACNHTVISYGTYGLTAAVLAGGHAVAFDVRHPAYHTMRMASHFPNWTIMQ